MCQHELNLASRSCICDSQLQDSETLGCSFYLHTYPQLRYSKFVFSVRSEGLLLLNVLLELSRFMVGEGMRAAGSFRMKLGARCNDREGYMEVCVCLTCHPPPGAEARGEREQAGAAGVSCRVDEHFSHFFFIFTRIVFKRVSS